jgi:hypothetical protein
MVSERWQGMRRGNRLPAAAAIAIACLCSAVLAASKAPDGAGISDPPAASRAVRHQLPPPQLQALAGKDWRDAGMARLLKPTLRQLLGVIKSGRHGTTVERFGSLA